MKRRSFLSAAGTIGVVSVAAGSTVVSSVYHDITTNQLLAEFDTDSRKTLDKFIYDLEENATELGLDGTMARKIALPTSITRNEKKKIEYKNRLGSTISITVEDGKRKLRIS